MKSPDPKPTFFYVANRDAQTRGVVHLDIEIYRATPTYYGEHNELIANMQWQGEYGIGNSGQWYGGTITIKTASTDNLVEYTTIVRRLLADAHTFKAPDAVIAGIEARHCTRRVYDPRSYQYVTRHQFRGPEYQKWIDDYKTLGHDNASAGVVAKTEDEARRLILISLASRANTDEITAFLTAGQPIMAVNSGHIPVWLDTIELLALSADTAKTA